MKLVILESPYAGNAARNTNYARQCINDCLHRGEAPIASHLLYTQRGVLNDNSPEERKLGIDAGLAWYKVAEGCVVYTDHGVSSGMGLGIARAHLLGVPVEMRKILPTHWKIGDRVRMLHDNAFAWRKGDIHIIKDFRDPNPATKACEYQVIYIGPDGSEDKFWSSPTDFQFVERPAS